MLSASELHERGLVQSNAGRFTSARSSFLKALPRADQPDIRAQIRCSLAYVAAETGSAAQGLSLCRQALDEPGISARMHGIVQSQLGLLYMRAGEGHQALAHLSDAITALADAPRELGVAHLNRGNVRLQRAEVSRAGEDFDAAVVAFRLAGEETFVARARHNRGYAHLLTGDLVTAMRLMETARQVLAPLSTVSRAVGEQDRAELLVAAGLTTEAQSALTDAARAYGARRLAQRQAEAELILARILLHEDPERAARVAHRSSRRFSRRGSDAWALRADAIALMSEIECGSRRRTLLTDAAGLSTRLRDRRYVQEAAALDLQAARVSVRLDDLPSARESLARFRPGTHSPLSTRLLAREVRAELASAQGRRSNALRHVRRGLAELHESQSAFGSLDLQSSFVGHGRRLALQGLRLAIATGRPESVFEWSERARTLVSRVAPVRPPSDPEAAARLARLRTLQAEVRDAEVHGPVPSALVRREAELRRSIRQRAWHDAGSGLVTEPSGLAEVTAELTTTDAALAAYVVLDEHLYVLVATSKGATVRELGDFAPVRTLLAGMQADLDMSGTSLPPQMRRTVRAGLRHRLQAIADHLVVPLADLIGEHRLVITPSGALAGTPWTMLPGLVGRPVAVPRSASAWHRDRLPDEAPGSAGLVAGPRVERAEEEVRKAASAWARSTVLLGDDASTAGVDRLARDVDVLHVSAHGRHSGDNPLFSGLELVDGPWFGYDIDQLARIPSTVVLSACELGRSSIRWAEEAIGMTAAWLHAGARCVIAAPAGVDDDVACEVLSATHALMAAGQPPADALADAAADRHDPALSPFVCYGRGW